uniref:Uncharacterized protein n=1 Tax=Romanomermis culicivorax TaxID=13658 RepID=A0A915ICL9_ROMCU
MILKKTLPPIDKELTRLSRGNFGYKPYPLLDESSRAKKNPQLSIKHGQEKTPDTTPDSKLVKKREARKTTKKDSRWSLINDQTKRTRSYHLSTTRMPAIIKSNDKTQQWNINANDIENDIYVDDQPMTKKPSQSVDQTHNFKKDYCSSLESRGFDSPEKCRDWCNGILKWVDYCKFK